MLQYKSISYKKIRKEPKCVPFIFIVSSSLQRPLQSGNFNIDHNLFYFLMYCLHTWAQQPLGQNNIKAAKHYFVTHLMYMYYVYANDLLLLLTLILQVKWDTQVNHFKIFYIMSFLIVI